jgi:hypothetical protein
VRRAVRIRLDFIVELDDDGITLPPIENPGSLLAHVAELVVPNAAKLTPGGRVSAGFTRESSREVRRLARAASRRSGT